VASPRPRRSALRRRPRRARARRRSARATAGAAVGLRRSPARDRAHPHRDSGGRAQGVRDGLGRSRLSIYAADGNEELPGTRRESGAIRWIGAGPDGKDLRIVVHTKSQESPVRVEVSIEAPAQEAPAVE